MELQKVSGLNKEGRDLSYDVLKGILILLVVLGHAIHDSYGEQCWDNIYFNTIYTFHMPLFVMISGYFCHSMTNKSFGSVARSKWKRIGIPWLIWSTVLVVIYYTSISFHDKPLPGIGANLKELYRMYTEIWYLVCIFVLSILFYPVLKWIQSNNGFKKWLLPFVFLILWLLSIVFFDETPNWMLKRCQIERLAFAFGLGLCYYFKIQYNIKAKWVLCVIAFSFIVLDRILWGRWISEYTLMERIIDGSACGIMAFAILKPACSFIKDSHIGHVFVYFGKNSLAIYVIHMCTRFLFIDNFIVLNESVLLHFVAYFTITLAMIEIIRLVFKSKSYILGV